MTKSAARRNDFDDEVASLSMDSDAMGFVGEEGAEGIRCTIMNAPEHKQDTTRESQNDSSVAAVLAHPKAKRSVLALAQVLHQHHPDRLPDVVMRDSGKPSRALPLAEVLVMRHGSRYNDLLPAVDQAYGAGGPGRAAVQRQMRAAFDAMIESEKYSSFRWTNKLWDAMHLWGSRELGPKIWRAPMGMGGSDVTSMLWKPDIGKRLLQLQDLGADLDEPTFRARTMDNKQYTVLEQAVLFRRADVVGALIGAGCDVERPFSGGSDQSLLELARDLIDKPMVTSQRPGDALAVCDLLSAAVARQHALRAIGELQRDARSRVEAK